MSTLTKTGAKALDDIRSHGDIRAGRSPMLGWFVAAILAVLVLAILAHDRFGPLTLKDGGGVALEWHGNSAGPADRP
ncbi:MAG: hypothetical protein H6851_14755 [Geminicoccaceae bacterium]|nr:hypothetical protein [Geminicoccaceae bacterium]MCB9944866.1 hypothetical protein [Geminicoccaceae bacterium]